MRRAKFRWLPALAGIVVALGLAEMGLRLIFSPLVYLPAPDPDNLPISTGSATQYTIRQYREGFAVSHYFADGARETGNPPISNGVNYLIFGNSFVEARQVPDKETMGSVLERIERRNGYPINVRQYGWDGTSTGTYLAMMPVLTARWHPDKVIVIITPFELTDRPFSGAWNWTVRTNNGLLEPVKVNSPRPNSNPRTITVKRVGTYILSHSALAFAVFTRIKEIRAARHASDADVPEDANASSKVPLLEIARLTVKSLDAASNHKLILVYVPEVDAAGDNRTDKGERALLDACDEFRVDCVSARSAMLALRRTHDELARGFENTLIGTGHLNALGHRLIAQLIAEQLQSPNRQPPL